MSGGKNPPKKNLCKKNHEKKSQSGLRKKIRAKKTTKKNGEKWGQMWGGVGARYNTSLTQNSYKKKNRRLKKKYTIDYGKYENPLHFYMINVFMHQTGLEPVTFGLEDHCSIQLSYWCFVYPFILMEPILLYE